MCERVDWSLCGPLRIGKVNCSNLAGGKFPAEGMGDIFSCGFVIANGDVKRQCMWLTQFNSGQMAYENYSRNQCLA